jgi:hypothetical protein
MPKVLTRLETAGETPSQFILNPNGWEAIAVKRTANDTFDMGGAVYPEARKAWGVPVALSNALTANSYYLLGEGAATIGRDAAVITTDWGVSGDLFECNQVLARTEGRFSLDVVRPMAVLKGTFVTA